MFGLIMRVYSVAFHVLLGFVMLAVGFVAWVSGQHTLHIGILPWNGPTLTYCLLGFGLAGIVLALLALKRILPILFTLWCLAVVVMLVRGYFLSPYYLGSSGLWTAVWLTLASLVAFAASALDLRGAKRHAARLA
jgi:hypothetical protein